MVHFDYLPEDKESAVLVAKTGCTPELAAILVNAAHLTRSVAASGNITAAIGLRQLISWAELLTDGIAPEIARDLAVINKAPDQDREVLTQQCHLTVDHSAIAAALKGRR